ncbi:DUF3304 domain-containing protein [Pantoea dispersa]|uniref:DUF3304 domain-containing protein n=1 Tax=Pantoea dispersa TaxID=59814 RepID=A0ABY2ZUY4_9GAMM|nr:DUF3304 domain-containing protein [Pantoea dispersa]MBS0907082.1 DUF3304 domain-containing protein [Pantoea dispersa]MDI6634605.1 DUF3304 domain-containing protein [Pantoea dispersa]RVU75640.1 DUF3304 domain-containing protein [Pantoea dispersa]TQC63621.1 DUF3304 domain-containing protein [Pantoea dispersa]
MKIRHYLVVLGALLLAGCGQPAANAESRGGGGTIEAINHTRWAINHFSVDGQSGIDIIGPYQGGGGGCCYGVPAKWRPGMTVKIDWETGVGYSMDFPGYADEQKFLSWAKKIKAQNKQHRAVVPVPNYTGQEICGITVHFLPCDEVRVTTSCANYGHPEHPIKESLKMPEPKVCPK